ncbi:hypothetical protein B0H10DRAFT_1957931 [Mycena sp. CBHHK59/15]|nr:hypothetical protein B0H10DRAFT_1957931 [Mycena sp. CBHHK59/15]
MVLSTSVHRMYSYGSNSVKSANAPERDSPNSDLWKTALPPGFQIAELSGPLVSVSGNILIFFLTVAQIVAYLLHWGLFGTLTIQLCKFVSADTVVNLPDIITCVFLAGIQAVHFL